MMLFKFFVHLSMFLALPGFAFGQARVRESKQLIKLLETKKEALMGQIDNTPYRGDQHASIKGYFENIAELNDSLSSDWRLNKRFNEVFSDLDLTSSCPRLWLDKETFQRLMKNCTKNRFFLCSEKVKQLGRLKEEFKVQLNDENRKKLEQVKECGFEEVK